MSAPFQSRRVAYMGDGVVLCRDCAVEEYVMLGGNENDLSEGPWGEDDVLIRKRTGLFPVDEHLAGNLWEVDGMTCDECFEVIVSPWHTGPADEEDEEEES